MFFCSFFKDIEREFSGAFFSCLRVSYALTHFLNMNILNLKEAYFFFVAWMMREVIFLEVFCVSKRTTFVEKLDDIESLSQIKVVLHCSVNPFWLSFGEWEGFQNRFSSFSWFCCVLRWLLIIGNFECERFIVCLFLNLRFLFIFIIFTVTWWNSDLGNRTWHYSGNHLTKICVCCIR